MQNYSFIQLICINLEQKRGIIVYNYVTNRILFIILHLNISTPPHLNTSPSQHLNIYNYEQ